MTSRKTTNKNKALQALVAVLLVLLCPQGMVAQDDTVRVDRPVSSMFMLDVGGASILDTYLSQVRYSGVDFRLGYEHFQALGHDPEHWVRQLQLGLNYDLVENQAGNHNEHSLMADAQWGLMRRWRNVAVNGLQLMGGASTQLHGGVIYNSNNSNNVVSAKIHASVGLMGAAVYNTHLRRLPITLRYQATLPVIGAFFSPEYDESYYEIYLGNHSGLVHVGWWGNRFDLLHSLVADLHLGGTVLRIGYRGRVESSWVSNLNTQIFTHSLVIGVGGEFLSVGKRKPSERSRIVSAMY